MRVSSMPKLQERLGERGAVLLEAAIAIPLLIMLMFGTLETGMAWSAKTAATNGVRTGMALHYNLGWLRQEENQVLSAPPEVARHFPERLQRLIGYDLGGPYLGFVEEGNPIRLLSDDRDGDYARTEPQLEVRRRAIEPIPFGTIDRSDGP